MASTPGRVRIERGSRPVLLALRTVPQWVLFLIVLGCVVGGLLLTGPLAAALLGVVAIFLAWLLVLAWPRLTPAQRLLRALVVILVAGSAIWRLVG